MMKFIPWKGSRASIVLWLHGPNYIISAGLLSMDSTIDGYTYSRKLMNRRYKDVEQDIMGSVAWATFGATFQQKRATEKWKTATLDYPFFPVVGRVK